MATLCQAIFEHLFSQFQSCTHDKWHIPANIKLKIEKTERLAERMLEKEREGKEESKDEYEEVISLSGGKTSVPQEIVNATPEQLAQDLITFARQEGLVEDDERIFIGSVAHHFWRVKGMDNKWNLPPKIELKMEKAERLAQQYVDQAEEATRQKEEEIRQKEIEEEKKELPNLISQCIQWANGRGLKRITLADVDAFLMSKKLRLHSENKRSLYATANVEIKSMKK